MSKALERLQQAHVKNHIKAGKDTASLMHFLQASGITITDGYAWVGLMHIDLRFTTLVPSFTTFKK